ncbi:SAM-dependent methyltransferase [Streptomyces griseoviridis]|uniref:Methyltransferase n=1 Tax=Streptomyces griseoviridis TaxID=45398 RepID=A0A3Q9L0D0_STRGD|nr:SAM-dependent methyltransferase [Streptomyces griseoviridis]AZS90057.1 SAM-dependent methyltransferase [Streptomyces griseoviridis]QCN90548.1 methyltransferase [Streptomyces griseoviridis]
MRARCADHDEGENVGNQPASGPASGSEADLGQDRPHSARMYDYYLGGKTNYAVDREAAQAVIQVFPAIEVGARANRAYMHRAARYLARQGITQFIDVGTGIPTAPNLHQVVQEVTPQAAVIYTDNDPIVRVYADELMDGTPEGRTCYIEADATRPDSMLTAIEATGAVDFSRPVALSLHALLHFVPDGQDPYGIVSGLLEPLAPGSFLSLTHSTGDYEPEAWQAITATYRQRRTFTQVRSYTDVLRFFGQLELVDPGLVAAHRWRPEPGWESGPVTDGQVSLYAGVGRKP